MPGEAGAVASRASREQSLRMGHGPQPVCKQQQIPYKSLISKYHIIAG